MATTTKLQEIRIEGDLTMTNRMKKTTTFIIGAVLVFALVLAMAFALVPNNAPTAYAETVKRLKEEIGRAHV